MEIKNRLFSYPVLCGATDDYLEETEFALEPSITERLHEFDLVYDFFIKCHSIENLIRNGYAKYVLHIECKTTAFRVALKSDVPHINYKLPKSKVNGEVEFLAMIVATTEINGYKSDELNEDYDGMSIDFPKGAILAYQNLPPIRVFHQNEKFANNDSIFTVVKKPSLNVDERRPLDFNIANDKIQIYVDENTFSSFSRYKQSKSIAMAMLVLPAITYMMNEVSGNETFYEKYYWFQYLKKYYHSKGKDFVDDIINADENPVMVAQEMLKNPVANAYRELLNLEV